MRGGVFARALVLALVAAAAFPSPVEAAPTPPFLWLPVNEQYGISYYVNDQYTLRNGLPTYSCCPVEVPNGSGTYKHTGTDYVAPQGAPIYAAARGTVTVAADGFPDGCAKRTTDNAGNNVWIRHDNGWTSIYAHMQLGSVAVRAGEVVKAGQRIGAVSNSGNTFGGACGGMHLHFELRSATGFAVANPYDRDTGWLWATDPPRHAVGEVPATPLPCDTTGTPTSTVYLPNVTKTLGGADGWVTPFHIQNVGTAAATIETSFYRFADGALVACRKSLDLAAGRTFADNPNDDGDLPHDTQFAVVVRSWGSPVAVAVNQLRGSGAATLAASYVGFTAGATKVFLPNVTRRFFGYDIPFIVQNLGTRSALVAARFVSFDGARTHTVPLTVAPGRSGVIDPDETAGLVDGTQYAVTITSSQPIGVVANAYNLAGSPVAYTHTGLAAGATTLYAPYAAKSSAGRSSPVVVQNLGSSATDAVLTFTPLGGGAAQTFTLAGIPPEGSRAFDPRFALGTSTPCAAASATCLGPGEFSLRLTATAKIAAVVLPTSAATAAAYAASGTPQTSAYLPVVRRNVGGSGGWTSEILVQSAGATSATARFHRFGDGALVATRTVTLVSGAAARVDPRSVTGLVDDTRYAVVVTSTGLLAALAYELGPEGDAAMVYEATPRP